MIMILTINYSCLRDLETDGLLGERNEDIST